MVRPSTSPPLCGGYAQGERKRRTASWCALRLRRRFAAATLRANGSEERLHGAPFDFAAALRRLRSGRTEAKNGFMVRPSTSPPLCGGYAQGERKRRTASWCALRLRRRFAAATLRANGSEERLHGAPFDFAAALRRLRSGRTESKDRAGPTIPSMRSVEDPGAQLFPSSLTAPTCAVVGSAQQNQDSVSRGTRRWSG